MMNKSKIAIITNFDVLDSKSQFIKCFIIQFIFIMKYVFIINVYLIIDVLFFNNLIINQ